MTLYKTARSKIVRMWTGKDEEGIGKSPAASLDDVLVTTTFERCLDLARKEGANGQLEPLWNNYFTDCVVINA